MFPCTNVTKFKAKFSVFNTRNEEIPATVYTGTQQLNGYFEYIRRDVLISHIQPQDEIQLMLHLNILAETITLNSQNTVASSSPEPRLAEAFDWLIIKEMVYQSSFKVAQDLEKMFNDERHADFTIVCRNEKECKEIRVRKLNQLILLSIIILKSMAGSQSHSRCPFVILFFDVCSAY